MKYIYRGIIVFEYIPNYENRYKGQIIQHKVHNAISAYDYCKMIPEDFRLLGEFFTIAYKHTQGEDIELKDIDVN